MRVPNSLPALVCLFVVASSAFGQEKPTPKELIDRATAAKKDAVEFRRKASDADKLAQDLANEARELLDADRKRLDDLFGPPVPMPPGPNPPAPADPFKGKVAAAFAADPGTTADKKAWATTLSGYYEAAIDAKIADDPTIVTAGDLLARKRATVTLTPDKLNGTRTVIGQELAGLLGTASTPLTAETRKVLPVLFRRIAEALDDVSK